MPSGRCREARTWPSTRSYVATPSSVRARDHTGGAMPARTGEQFLEGLRARDREVWLSGERVKDVTTHPQLEGAPPALAAVFDRQHEFPDDSLRPAPEPGEPIAVSH